MKALTPDDIVEAVNNSDKGLSSVESRHLIHYLLKNNFSYLTLSRIGEYTDSSHYLVFADLERMKDHNLMVYAAEHILASIRLKIYA